MQGLGVFGCHVKIITKVVREGGTTLAEEILNGSVRQSLSIEKVACRDTDGMSRLVIKAIIVRIQLEYCLCGCNYQVLDLCCSGIQNVVTPFVVVVTWEGILRGRNGNHRTS